MKKSLRHLPKALEILQPGLRATGRKPCVRPAFDGGSFTIYQKVESVRYQKYTGSYLLQDDILSGNYSDNTPWGSSYTVTADEANNTITLTSTINTSDVSVYTRATIPESVKNDAIDMQGVRAAFFRLL